MATNFEEVVGSLYEKFCDEEAFVLVHIKNGKVQAGTNINDPSTVKELLFRMYEHFDTAKIDTKRFS